MIDLSGRIAVITGAGGGLGRSHALLLASRGAAIVVNDLGGAPDGTGAAAGPADAVVAEIIAAGGQAVANHASVSDPEGAKSIVETAIENYGQIDILVNNAGILRDKSLLKMSVQDIELVIDVHLKGTMFVTQAAFAHMKDAGFGRLIHTTSAAGLFGNFGQANYSAAKMGICGFSRTVAEEGAKYNITSNVIAPVAKSRLTEDLLGDMANFLDQESVSALVAALASPDCEISREVFSVAAGRYARVFTGLTPGWRGDATPEAVTENFKTIMDTSDFLIPTNAMSEIQQIAALVTS